MSAPIVVVGASLAGLRAVQALRAQGHEGPVVVIGDEPHPPYDRTQLSKGCLDGTVGLADALLADPREIERLGAEWWLGSGATSLRADGAHDTRLRVELADGSEVPAAGVVVATGARARLLPAAFGDVHVLRRIEDAESLATQLRPHRLVTIIGCGLVGAETAAKAVAMGCSVTVVDAAHEVFTRQFGPLLARRLRDEHEAHGVRVIVGRTAVRRSAEAVTLDDGTELPTDVLVAGVGARPNDEWLAGSGVELGDGVRTDRWGRTSLRAVVAAGDVACRDSGRGRERSEHWTNAKDMPAVAVRALLAELREEPEELGSGYDPVPYFWSGQYGRRVQVAGWPGSLEARVVAGSAETQFAAVEEDAGVVVAALGWEAPKDFARCRRMIHQQRGGRRALA